jgi:fructan beta-fructosidase
LDNNGKKVWVLIVNINPGGPNKGSASQYFLGDFDGKTFSPLTTETKWADYGPDEYAGITWSNTGNRRIFLGWMSNWMYANQVPTKSWRSAMTLPRDLKLKQVGNDLLLASSPIPELSHIESKPVIVENLTVDKELDLGSKIPVVKLPCRINLELAAAKDFQFSISNELGEELLIGFDTKQNQYYIDRTNAGKKDFNKEFAAKHVAPRFISNDKMSLSLIIDVASVELFGDDGLSVMTSIFFPNKTYNKITVQAPAQLTIKKLEYIKLKSF